MPQPTKPKIEVSSPKFSAPSEVWTARLLHNTVDGWTCGMMPGPPTCNDPNEYAAYANFCLAVAAKLRYLRRNEPK